VVGVEASGGTIRADLTILAAGVWTPALLGADGRSQARLPIEPVRGQILSLEAPLPRTQAISWSKDVYFVPKRDGSWVVGATLERVGFDRRVTAGGVAWLLEKARSVFPGLADACFGQAWAGLRPVSVDGLPSIGALPGLEGLLVAAGHGRNGVLLAPITARLIADEWLGKARPDAARALSPARHLHAHPVRD
jgi:glycine oxidase